MARGGDGEEAQFGELLVRGGGRREGNGNGADDPEGSGVLFLGGIGSGESEGEAVGDVGGVGGREGNGGDFSFAEGLTARWLLNAENN